MSGWHNQDGAYALVSTLARAGLRHAVVSPGSRNTPVVLALHECRDISTHVVLDERDAAFVGLGLARTLGEPVLLSCTSGSATANYLPAVMEASQSGIPLVVVTADRPPELHGCGAPQTVEQDHLYGTYARWSTSLEVPSDLDGQAVPGHLDRVVRVALEAVEHARGAGASKPGPVHINAPYREPLWQAEWTVPKLASVDLELPRPSPVDPSWLAGVTRRVESAQRGLIYCGALESGRCDTDELATALGALARKLGWPVLAEPTSQLRFGAAEVSHVVSSYDAMLRTSQFADGHAPDFVLRVGRAPLAKHVRRWMKENATGKAVLFEGAGERLDPDQVVDTIVPGEIAANCRALIESIATREDNTWLRSWLRNDAAATGVIGHSCDSTWWEGAIARNVVQALPADATLHVAASMPVRDLDSFTSAQARKLAVHCNRGANGIDGLLATAAGEAIARPEKPTVLLSGDLAFLHNAGALATAQALGARLTIVAIDNGGGGIFEHLPIARHSEAFQRFFLTPQAVDVSEVARGYRSAVRRVESVEQLREALADAFGDHSGPSVIHAVVERAESNERRRRTFAAVSKALEARGSVAGEVAA